MQYIYAFSSCRSPPATAKYCKIHQNHLQFSFKNETKPIISFITPSHDRKKQGADSHDLQQKPLPSAPSLFSCATDQACARI
jgi:hypothetical protein